MVEGLSVGTLSDNYGEIVRVQDTPLEPQTVSHELQNEPIVQNEPQPHNHAFKALELSPYDAAFSDVPEQYKEREEFERLAAGRLSFLGRAKIVGELVDKKNAAYGDSFARSGDVLKAFYPDGVQPHQLQDMLTITRVVDKLFRVATKKDAFGESPWQDICGYSLLALGKL